MYIRKPLKECCEEVGIFNLVNDRTHQGIAYNVSREEALSRFGDWIVECGYTDGFTSDPDHPFETTLWIYPANNN